MCGPDADLADPLALFPPGGAFKIIRAKRGRVHRPHAVRELVRLVDKEEVLTAFAFEIPSEIALRIEQIIVIADDHIAEFGQVQHKFEWADAMFPRECSDEGQVKRARVAAKRFSDSGVNAVVVFSAGGAVYRIASEFAYRAINTPCAFKRTHFLFRGKYAISQFRRGICGQAERLRRRTGALAAGSEVEYRGLFSVGKAHCLQGRIKRAGGLSDTRRRLAKQNAAVRGIQRVEYVDGQSALPFSEVTENERQSRKLLLQSRVVLVIESDESSVTDRVRLYKIGYAFRRFVKRKHAQKIVI